jgi:hypothetical protein
MTEERQTVKQKKEESPFLKMVMETKPTEEELVLLLAHRLKVLHCLTPLYKKLYNTIAMTSKVYKSIEASALKTWGSSVNSDSQKASLLHDFTTQARIYAEAIIAELNY